MSKTNKKKTSWGILVLILLVIAFCCRWVNYYPLFIDEQSAWYVIYPVLKNIIRNVIHISLLIAWCISIRARILEKRIRNLVLSVGYLIMLWFVIRICKWDFVMTFEAPLVRYLWYAFYIPIILIPLQGLFIAVLTGCPEDYQIPKWMKWMYVPAGLLILLVFTNDLHYRVFSFPEGMKYFNHIYKHEPFYFVIILWIAVLTVTFIGILIKKSQAPGKRKYQNLPFLIIGCFVAIWVIHTLKLIQLDQTLLNCLMIILLLESQMELGLIRTNSNYDILFRQSTIAAQIVDLNYQPVYSSASAMEIDEKLLRQEMKEPVVDGDILLQCKPISGGYVLWQNNITEIKEILEELRDTREQLEENYELQKAEVSLREQQLQAEEKSRLYDRIAREVSPQLVKAEKLVAEADKHPEKLKELLEKICVLSAYIKRLSNILLIAEEQKEISSGELESCLRESMDNLRLAKVLSFLDSQCEGSLPIKNVIEIYHTFERVTEALLDKMNAVMVTLRCKEGKIAMRIQIGCSEELKKSDLPDLRLTDGMVAWDIQEEDLVIDFRMDKGGAGE